MKLKSSVAENRHSLQYISGQEVLYISTFKFIHESRSKINMARIRNDSWKDDL